MNCYWWYNGAPLDGEWNDESNIQSHIKEITFKWNKKKDYFIVHQDNFQNKITDNLNFIIVKEFQIKIFETISF